MKNNVLNLLMRATKREISRNGFITFYDNVDGIGNIKVLTSYDTIIAIAVNGRVERLSRDCLCSTTTIKDLKEFINYYTDLRYENKEKFEKVITDAFILDDENNYIRK